MSRRGSHSRIAIVFRHRLNGVAVFYELSNRSDDNFKIYYLFAVYEPDHFSSVVLFAFLSCSRSSRSPTLSRWCVFSFSAAYQPLSLPVFPRFSLRDPVTMIKRIPDSPESSSSSFSKKLGSLLLSFFLPPSLSHSFSLSSHLTLKHIKFFTRIKRRNIQYYYIVNEISQAMTITK